ncbi:kinesin-related protein 4-like isoform X2 [Mercenaria mercenaria]|uniref:kinesin-related protein 4-like isoform X2 n=1 Tax=Mercenaria mercenaria TaxID=6596 RepID=UPI00234E6FE1|nr:kinesin-related protein 4-like isoform X2 [Mercenaria mercenaria]
MSEPLIPVISTKSVSIISRPEIQESQVTEESQSLLPQVPAVSITTYQHLESENDKWLCNATSESSHKGLCHETSGNKVNKNDNCTTSNNDSLKSSTPLVLSSSSRDVSLSQPVVSASQKEEVTLSQPLFSTIGKELLTLSQVDQDKQKAGRIVSSQGSVTLAAYSQSTVSMTSPLEKDPADRLDRLVSSLDKVPRRQKMVMEATILQCITSLQDSLNSKLRKQPSIADTSGILRKLLQTTQTGLMKLTEQHKLEKLQLSQTGTQSTQQTSSQLTQSAISDLGKRQKRMFSLLKRQKYLVDLYKTSRRPGTETDHTAPITQVTRKTIQIPKSENINQSTNAKQDRNYSGKAEGGTPNIISDTKTKKTSKDKIESDFERRRDIDNSKVTVVQDDKEQFIGIGTKETKVIKDIDFRGQFKEKAIEKHTDLRDNDDGILSQDLTTVPDTQDFITQDSVRTSGKEFESDDNVAAAAGSDGELSECDDKEFVKKITEQGAETNMNVASEKDKINAGKMAHIENVVDKASFKRDLGVNVKTDGTIKKQKLNDIKESINTKESQNKANTSEMLWLKMLRNDTNKEIEKRIVSKDRTVTKAQYQELFTSNKLEREQMRLNINGTSVEDTEKYKQDFQFIKPSVTPRQDQQEVEKRTAKSKDQVKDWNVSSDKIDNGDHTDDTKTRKHFESVNEREVLCPDEKEGELVDLSSPPVVTVPGETWHNVSPTATSMSSDVFMVKVKDLQKRMKRREELSQNIDSGRYLASEHLECTGINGKSSGKRTDFKVDLEQNSNMKTDNLNTHIVKEKDTVSEAIDSVIKQSREMFGRNVSFRKRIETFAGKPTKKGELDTCDVNQTVLQATKFKDQTRCSQEPSTSNGQVPLNDARDVKTATCKQLTVGLPTLKELLNSGQLSPGKLVLSCHVKGKTYRASLTPHGKVRTLEGLMFVTASKWVSTLKDAAPVNKRKAYEMVLYKGRQLLSFCFHNPGLSRPNEQSASIIQNVSIKPSPVKQFTEQGTQVMDSELPKLSSQMTEVDNRLSSLLSNCVVQLLTEQDFVSCNDLPDNFWTEDFSKVRLQKDIWDTVDAW